MNWIWLFMYCRWCCRGSTHICIGIPDFTRSAYVRPRKKWLKISKWTKKRTKCGQAHAVKNVNQIFVFFHLLLHLVRMVWFIGFCSVAITLFYNTVTRQMMCCFMPMKTDTRILAIWNRCQIGLFFTFISCDSKMLRLRCMNYKKKKKEKIGEKDFAFQAIFLLVSVEFYFTWVRPHLPHFRMCVANIMYSNCTKFTHTKFTSSRQISKQDHLRLWPSRKWTWT